MVITSPCARCTMCARPARLDWREGKTQRSGLGCAISQGNRGGSDLAAVIALGSEERGQPIGWAFDFPIELNHLKACTLQIRWNKERLAANLLGIRELFVLARG